MYALRSPYLSASGDIFSQVWGAISDQAGSGAGTAGQIANFLIGAGFSVAQVGALLDGVSQVAAVTPQMLQAAQAERAWLNQYEANFSRNNWVWPVAIIGILLYVGSRSGK